MKNSLEKNQKSDTGSKRLDIYLVDKGFVVSRQKAQIIIQRGLVSVDGVLTQKINKKITDSHKVEVADFDLYVGRGGEKLEYALEHLDINPKDAICMDVGSSTGGFTEVLLRNGARKVYSIDVGTDQFDSELSANSRVVLMESTDIRKVKELPEKINLCVIDVSFISLKSILPSVFPLMKEGGIIAVLVKPQFEVGPDKIKKGIVTKESDAQEALQNIKNFVLAEGKELLADIESQPKGKKGNQEYFIKIKM